MRASAIVVGLMVVGGAAQAGEPAPRTMLAAVDANGHVTPVQVGQNTTGAQPTTQSSSPCPAVAALDRDAARDLVARLAPSEAVEPGFALAVAKIESHYSSTALSGKGAFGLMQLMPETAKRFAVDLCDPEGNVRGGLRFLHALQARYRNPFTVLAAYNAGEEAVRRARGVPPYPETVRFVADVLNDLNGWPAVGNPSSAGASAGIAASSTPDPLVVEPQAQAPAAGTEVPVTAEPARWSAGFVMHIQ